MCVSEYWIRSSLDQAFTMIVFNLPHTSNYMASCALSGVSRNTRTHLNCLWPMPDCVSTAAWFERSLGASSWTALFHLTQFSQAGHYPQGTWERLTWSCSSWERFMGWLQSLSCPWACLRGANWPRLHVKDEITHSVQVGHMELYFYSVCPYTATCLLPMGSSWQPLWSRWPISRSQ